MNRRTPSGLAMLAAVAVLQLSFLSACRLHADPASDQQKFAGAVNHILAILGPAPGSPPQTFSTGIRIVRAQGLPKEVAGQELSIAFQAPDRLRLSLAFDGHTYSAGRIGQQLWIHAPRKNFGVVGLPGIPAFNHPAEPASSAAAAAPVKPPPSALPDFKLPVKREQLLLLPLLCSVESMPPEDVSGVRCTVLRVQPRPEARAALKIPEMTVTLWIRDTDHTPLRIGYADGKSADAVIELIEPKFENAWNTGRWSIQPAAGDQVETVALSHLVRFVSSAPAMVNQRLPVLGPLNGERRVVARHGEGRLEVRDGTKVLFLKGTPEQMGGQHGTLMKKEVRFLVDRILYGVGVGSSFAKGRWFFGEIEEAQARLQPFVTERHLREMDALAAAAGVRIEEARLANFFPELFHCSGFALYGDATAGGQMFHGRVLDYMKGVGLEQNACVIVMQPDEGNAWVNLGYAGFLGTVTAMNDKHIAIGEMGGRGEGQWDGKPMAQLMREVMERASTIDEAVEIMRNSRRTCEYYYVISDGRSNRAVGIAATPDKFETIWAGDSHPQLPHPIKDTVLLSAGDRYETLVERVRKNYGQIDAASARELMTKPVCMSSNIQSVLFAPQTLDFWVANADSKNVASHTRFTPYNLTELLRPEPAAASGGE